MELVVCIDIGSTYTGYAFSSKKEYEEQILNIHLNEEWMSGHANLHTYKCPSIALLQQDKTIHSYGYEAERRYVQLLETKQQELWYYFKHFKTELKSKQFRKETVIEEQGGKSLSGVSLFTAILKYFKTHFLDSLSDSAKYRSSEISTNSYIVKYVITVPTKWDNASRMLMKSTAKKASLTPCYIYSESEAAGRYCRFIPIRATDDGPFYLQGPFCRHVIVNIGGSGIDAAVQEILEDRSVKEFAKNVGNSTGGTRVDADFLKFLNSLFGNEFIDLYSKRCKLDFLELQYEFDLKKRKFSLDSDVGTIIELPYSMIKMYIAKFKQSLQFMIDDTDFVGRILSQDGSLVLDKTVMKDMFGPAVKNTVGYLTNLLRDPETKQCDNIILVGGFADSPIVTGAIKFYFPNVNMTIVEESEIAVLRGGVLMGHNPGPVTIAKPKYTYGIGMAVPFLDEHHPLEKLFKVGDAEYCSDVFRPHLLCDNDVNLGEFSSELCLKLNRVSQKQIIIPVYASVDKYAKFTTEDGCSFLGKMAVAVPDNKDGKTKIKVRMTLLGKTLIAEATNVESGIFVHASFGSEPVKENNNTTAGP